MDGIVWMQSVNVKCMYSEYAKVGFPEPRFVAFCQVINNFLIWKQLDQNINNIQKRKCLYWITMKTFCWNVKLLTISDCSFCHNVFFKIRPLQICQKFVLKWERLKTPIIYFLVWTKQFSFKWRTNMQFIEPLWIIWQ